MRLGQITAVVAAITLIGCANRDRAAGNIDIQWEPDGRSYTAIVKDDEDLPWIALNCHYLGKKPEEPVETSISRDWKSQDTDFYHYEMVNLLGETIELVDVSFRLKEGKGGKIYETRPQSEIEKDLGGTILEIDGKLERRNSWVFGLGNANVLHKIYRARSGGKTILIDTHLVYKR